MPNSKELKLKILLSLRLERLYQLNDQILNSMMKDYEKTFDSEEKMIIHFKNSEFADQLKKILCKNIFLQRILVAASNKIINFIN